MFLPIMGGKVFWRGPTISEAFHPLSYAYQTMGARFPTNFQSFLLSIPSLSADTNDTLQEGDLGNLKLS